MAFDENKSMLENLKENLNGQNIQGKLEYDPQIFKKVFSKIIYSYYNAIFYQNPKELEKVCDNLFIEKTTKIINKDSKYYKNSAIALNIVSANLVNQTIETLAFIKDISMKVNVVVKYERRNLLTNEITLIELNFTDQLLIKNYEEGWLLSAIEGREYHTNNSTEI